MSTAASDDLIARVRAYLAGLEPPVPADDLTDEEVAGVTLAALEWLEDEMLWLLLPARCLPLPELPAMPPILIDVNREGPTALVSADTRYTQFLEFGTARRITSTDFTSMEFAETLARLFGRPATPSGPPPRPH